MNERHLPILAFFLAVACQCTFLVGGCHEPAQQVATVTPTATIAAPRIAPSPTARKLSTISEISLQRDPRMVKNPHWLSMTIKRDGTATRVYFDTSKRNDGTYRATLPPQSMSSLLQFIEASDFTHFGFSYGDVGTDIATDTLSIVINGKKKTVFDCGAPYLRNYGKKEFSREAKEIYEKEHREWLMLQQIKQRLLQLDSNTQWKKINDRTPLLDFTKDMVENMETLKRSLAHSLPHRDNTARAKR